MSVNLLIFLFYWVISPDNGGKALIPMLLGTTNFPTTCDGLTNPIHAAHQKEWFIQELLPLTRIPLTQQKIYFLTDALKQAMKIEAMVGYPGTHRVAVPTGAPDLSQVQNQIAILTEKIQELTLPKVGRPQVWCTGCHTEGHHVSECPRYRGA